jgi:hypothetical protein
MDKVLLEEVLDLAHLQDKVQVQVLQEQDLEQMQIREADRAAILTRTSLLNPTQLEVQVTVVPVL